MNNNYKLSDKPSVIIIGKHNQIIESTRLNLLLNLCTSCGYNVFIEQNTLNYNNYIQNICSINLQDIEQLKPNFAIVIGGDGTMISAARVLAPHKIPLIGINNGRLGFVTDVNLQDVTEQIPLILGGKYFIEQRNILQGNIINQGKDHFNSLAVNDIVISRSSARGMIEVAVYVNQEYMCTQRADGLIISTATGSTAYALSVGGPILHPQIQGIILAPIAPHSLSDRPIVVPAESKIMIKVGGNNVQCAANFDMQSYNQLYSDYEVHIEQSAHKALFVHGAHYSYYETLRKKLHWQEHGGI